MFFLSSADICQNLVLQKILVDTIRVVKGLDLDWARHQQMAKLAAGR